MMEIKINKISMIYKTNTNQISVIKEISFKVNKHEIVSVIGPNGCGKSTLLKIISGLLEPTDGRIIIEENLNKKDQTNHRKNNIGFMFQKPLLFRWRSVIDNLHLMVELLNLEKDTSLINNLLTISNLEDFRNSFPSKLSIGMQQLLSFCMTIISNPKILLLDEPFSSIDPITKTLFHLKFLNIWRKYEMAVICVTHDLQEAIFLSDRIIVMSERPSTVILNLEIDLPRPRDISILNSNKFNDYSKILRSKLYKLSRPHEI